MNLILTAEAGAAGGSASMLIMLVLMFADRGALPEVPTVLTPPKDAPVYTPGSDISVPGATPAPSGEPTPAPQAVPSPVPSADPEPTKEPEPVQTADEPEPAAETAGTVPDDDKKEPDSEQKSGTVANPFGVVRPNGGDQK